MPGFSIFGHPFGPPNTVETSRRHRYAVRFLGPTRPELLFYAYKFTVPTFEFHRHIMYHKQDQIGMPGQQVWGLAEMSFYRAHGTGGDLAAAEIYQWWSDNILNVETSTLRSDGLLRRAPFKRTIAVEILDGMGLTVYTYLLLGAWPQKTTPQGFDWTDSTISDITVTFALDKMRELPGAASVLATALCGPSEPAPPPPPTPPAPPVQSQGQSIGDAVVFAPAELAAAAGFVK